MGLGAFFLFSYHWFALGFSPLPWFDETYFASMTLHFMKSGEFNPQISPMMEYYYPQAKAYGPLYFILMSGVFKIFGFGLLQMRFPALLFGFLFVFIFQKVLKESGISRKGRLFYCLLLLFDPIYLQNIHSGRMDSFALFWVGLGVFCLLKAFKSDQYADFLGVGICFGLAVLTTPRISVPLMGPALGLAYYTFSKFSIRRFFQSFLVAFTILVLYSFWVFWGFGGVSEWWNYFFGPPPTEALHFKNLADGYVRTRLYIPSFQYPLFGLVFIVLIISVRFLKISRLPLFWISLVNIICFYYFVNDTGIYGIFSVPFVYLILIALSEGIYAIQPKIYIPVFCLLVVNLIIFGFKNIMVINSIPTRDQQIVEDQIARHIPKGSHVIGDEVYYYSVMKSGSDFQYMDRGADTPRRRKYHFNDYRFQYVVVREPVVDFKQFAQYQEKGKFEFVADIEMPPPYFPPGFLGIIQKITKVPFNNGYGGKIYRR
jgi:4-amino-4-deoxy-L-arabinose transferase-like glycosyltransferase